jgi:hypothetical protein
MKSPKSRSGSKSQSKTKSKSKLKAKSSTSPKVGLLIAATDANDVWASYITAFKNALNQQMSPTVVSYVPRPFHGAAGGDYSAYYVAAQQLINDRVDIIVTAGNLAARACKDAANQTATQTNANPIPIVVASAGDLTDLADSNLTGCTNGQQNLDILKARIGKMSQLYPAPTAVGIVGNDTVPPVGWAMHQAFGLIPQLLDVPAYLVPFRQQSDLKDPATIRKTLNSSLPNTVNALFVCSDPLLRTHGGDFVAAAHSAPKMNTMHEFGEWYSKHGGDLCFGPDFTTLFQKAAGFVYQFYQKGVPLPAGYKPKETDCVQTP